MSDVTSQESAYRRVAIREFAVWALGAIAGAYAGMRLGFLVGHATGAFVGGWIGWGAGGYACWRAVRALARGTPKYMISVRAARDACFGMILGVFVGSYLAEKATMDQGLGVLIGIIAGLMSGAFIGEASAQRSLRTHPVSQHHETPNDRA